MPLHADFQKILNQMIKKHGAKEGKRRFYAWVNSRGLDDTKSLGSQKSKLKKRAKNMRASISGDLNYMLTIHAKVEDGKRFVDAELIDAVVSRPVDKPAGMRWQVKENALQKAIDSLPNAPLVGPIGELKEGHRKFRPIASLVKHWREEDDAGALWGRFELIEEDQEWADYAWNKIQSGEWRYISPDVDHTWNYTVEDNVITPEHFWFKRFNFVPRGAFPNSQIYRSFSEGIAAMLEEEELRSLGLSSDNDLRDKKMSDEELKEIQAKLDESEKAKTDAESKAKEQEKEIEKLKDQVASYKQKADLKPTQAIEKLRTDMAKLQEENQTLLSKEAERQKQSKVKVASRIADLRVKTGRIGIKDFNDEVGRLVEKYDNNALEEMVGDLEIHAMEQVALSPKEVPLTIQAGLDAKERRRAEMFPDSLYKKKRDKK